MDERGEAEPRTWPFRGGLRAALRNAIESIEWFPGSSEIIAAESALAGMPEPRFDEDVAAARARRRLVHVAPG